MPPLLVVGCAAREFGLQPPLRDNKILTLALPDLQKQLGNVQTMDAALTTF